MGGGPAGLYSAILFKKALPGAAVEVFERNRPDDTFGWGVVFSDSTMGSLLEADARAHARIVDEFYHWDDIDVHFKGQAIRSGGHGFAGISRRKLLNILQKRAAALGVKQTFQHEIDDDDEFGGADLVVIAEGANSKARTRQVEKFAPSTEVRKGRYICLGTTQKFPAFTFPFANTKLAMEDAFSLVRPVSHAKDVQSGLESYQTERSIEAQKLQNAARNRMEWFENVARYESMEPLQFAYSLLSGSQRIGHANLKLRDAGFIDRIETRLASKCSGIARPLPPMFLPFRLRGMQLVNRVVVSPMAQYRAVEGVPTDWHLAR